jgi:hypothetical protein
LDILYQAATFFLVTVLTSTVLSYLFNLQLFPLIAAMIPIWISGLLLVIVPTVTGIVAFFAGYETGSSFTKHLMFVTALGIFIFLLVSAGCIAAGYAQTKPLVHAAMVGFTLYFSSGIYETLTRGDMSYIILAPLFALITSAGNMFSPSPKRSKRLLWSIPAIILCGFSVLVISEIYDPGVVTQLLHWWS